MYLPLATISFFYFLRIKLTQELWINNSASAHYFSFSLPFVLHTLLFITIPPKSLHCCRHRLISRLIWSLISTWHKGTFLLPWTIFLTWLLKLYTRLIFFLSDWLFTPLLDASDPPNWWMLLSPLYQGELVQIPSPDLYLQSQYLQTPDLFFPTASLTITERLRATLNLLCSETDSSSLFLLKSIPSPVFPSQ